MRFLAPRFRPLLLKCHPSIFPLSFFAAFLCFFHSLGPSSYRVSYSNTVSGKWKVQARGGKRASRLQRDTQGDTCRYPERYPKMVKIACSRRALWKPPSFLLFSSSIDLLFIPFSVPTSRACKKPSGRNCIEKSFLARFEPVSSQKPKSLILGRVKGHCEGTEARI